MAKYTDEFIAKVKRIYPNSKEIHLLADQGNAMLGRWLDDSSKYWIDTAWLLKQSHIGVIHDRCRQEMEKVALYQEWYKDYAS